MGVIEILENFKDSQVTGMALYINQKLTIMLGLAVFVYTAIQVALKMTDNSDKTYQTILTKPILIMLFAATFSIQTINFVDAGTDFINGTVRTAITNFANDPVGYREQLLKIETAEKRVTNDETINEEILAEVELLIQEADKLRQEHEFRKSQIAYQRATSNLTSQLSWLAMTVISVFRIFYLSILLMMLPICLALSLFPTFDDIIKQWVHHYISVSLWLSAIYLVDAMIFMSYDLIGSTIFEVTGGGSTLDIIRGFLADPQKASGDIVKAWVVSNLMSVIAILSYLMVPKFTSWIIGKASSTGSAMSGITGVVQTAAIAAAALASGGAAAAGGGAAAASGGGSAASGSGAAFSSVKGAKSKKDE